MNTITHICVQFNTKQVFSTFLIILNKMLLSAIYACAYIPANNRTVLTALSFNSQGGVLKDARLGV